MKQYINIFLAATALTTVSCSDSNFDEILSGGEKEMINLTVGVGDNTPGVSSRAAGDVTYAGFTAKTRIIMRLQSDHTNGSSHKYTRTLAYANQAESGKNYSGAGFDEAYIRYWDDCFGRSANLSAFAVAIPNTDNHSLLPENALKGGAWTETADDNKISWTVDNSNTTTKTIQDATTLTNQDLVYSNNIKDGSSVGGRYVYNFSSSNFIPNIDAELTGTNVFTPGRMCFQSSVSGDATAPGRFDKGHLVFNHALSRITITIKAGTGFNKTETGKFVLDVASNNGIQALGMNVSGNLDVAAGSWSDITTGTITTQPTVERVTSPESASYKTTMQMLPNYSFTDGSNTNVLQFKIDDNQYYITQDMIFDALKANASNNGLATDATSYTMEQGKNYVLTITVNKTKVENLTANIANWQEIAAQEQELHNSYVTINFKAPAGSECDNFDIYRMKVDAGSIHTDQTPTTADNYVNKAWMGNYTEYVTPTQATDYSTSKKWTTSWVYEDNKTFYHFRTVKKNTDVKETNSTTDDYFEVSAGPVATNDPHWGAPMESTVTDYAYSTTDNATSGGYGANISKAIGSTNSDIKIQEFHMLSEINVIVKTVEGTAGVKLYDNNNTPDNAADDKATKVTLYQFKKNGQVKMGNGFVKATGEATESQDITVPSPFYKEASPAQTLETNKYTWRVVPQLLSRGDSPTDKIAIKIQTPDNNEYYCIADLSTICPTGSTTPITEWLPNHRYIYTFKISKKGIESITCTLAEWIDVTAADKDITLED